MKQFMKTNYKNETESISHYSLKDSLLQNTLQSKKALHSSRLAKDSLSSNSMVNSRGKSYEPRKTNRDSISTDIPNKKPNEYTNTKSLINQNSNSKISIYNLSNVENKKSYSNISADNLINNPSSFSNYSNLGGKDNFKPYKLIGNFLSEKPRDKINKKTLVLDLDETLIHSSFNQLYMKSDIILNVELDRKRNVIHVLKRPGVDEFLSNMTKHYEVVIFTASVSAYANPLINQLDNKRCVSQRLFREHCTILNGNFIKDMRKLGRNLKDVILLDNNPSSYTFNKENGLPIKTWINDKRDKELSMITPILEFLAYVDDVRDYIKKFVFGNEINYNTAYSIVKNQKIEKSKYDSNLFGSYSPLRSPNRTIDSPRQNININIINNNFSNFYVDKNSNLIDRIAQNSKILEDQKSRKIDNNNNRYGSSSNLFRSSFNNLKENNYMKVSVTKFTPTYLNSTHTTQKIDNNKDRSGLSDVNYSNNNSYFDKSNFINTYSVKKNEQSTPSRTNYDLGKNTNQNLSDYMDRNYQSYNNLLNKSNQLNSASFYNIGSTLNNRNDKNANQIKTIENEVITRGTDSYRSQISKSLERPNTSNLKQKITRIEEISPSILNANKNIKSYTPHRVLNPSDKLMAYTTSFFDRNNLNTNYSRTVDRKVEKSSYTDKNYNTNNNTSKYDEIDTLYSSKVYSNINSKYNTYNDSKPYRVNDVLIRSSSRDKINYNDKDSIKYPGYNTSISNFYSQTVRDKFDTLSFGKY